MSLKEIEKLKEKVLKDPNSKLFVPLAEEYRKEGMLDEAAEVLLSGLERQPGYASARVALGKIYLEKGMMAEARAEFETVIKAIPDNLFALKKLAEIYRDTGEAQLALNAFRKIYVLNPKDEEVYASIKTLEDLLSRPPVEEVPVQQPREEFRMPEEEAVAEPQLTVETSEESPELAIVEEAAAPEEPVPAMPEDDLQTFRGALFGEEKAAGAEEELQISDETFGEDFAAEEATEEAEEEIGFGLPEEITEETPVAEDIGNAFEVSFEEEAPTETADEIALEEHEEMAEETAAAEDVSDAFEVSFDEEVPAETVEEIVALEEEPAEILPQAEAPSTAESLQEADRLVGEGNYAGAIRVYQEVLSVTPDDKAILQRVEELKTLLKLMGKDKEVLISKLNAFLDSINKRHDEFFRRS